MLPVLPVALCVVLALATGAYGIPHNDDWSFARSALTMHRTGEVELVGWAQMSLVGQLVLAQPLLALSASVAALDTFTVLCAVLAVVSVHAVARRLSPPGRAWLLPATLACCPVLLPLVTTFMTDLPALALSAAALALGLRGLAGDDGGGWSRTAALLLALAAVTVRETSLCVAAGLLAGWLVQALSCRRRGTGRAAVPLAVAAGVSAGLAVLAFLRWRAGLPLSMSYGPVRLSGQAGALGRLLVTGALLLLPVLLGRPAVRAGRWARAAAAGAAVLVDVLLWQQWGLRDVLTGNLLQSPGPIGAVLRGPRPALLPPAVWSAVGLLALAATVLLAVRVADLARAGRVRRVAADVGQPAAVTWCLRVALLAAAVAVLTAQAHGKAYDRYLLLPVLLAGALLAGNLAAEVPARSRDGWAAGVAAAALAALGLVLCLDIDTYDAARWRAGQAVVAGRAGTPGLVPPHEVDAGFEWVSFHAAGPADAQWSPDEALPSWDRRMHVDPCWVVANGPLADSSLREVGRLPWRDGLRRRQVFVVYARCGAPSY